MSILNLAQSSPDIIATVALERVSQYQHIEQYRERRDLAAPRKARIRIAFYGKAMLHPALMTDAGSDQHTCAVVHFAFKTDQLACPLSLSVLEPFMKATPAES